MINLKEVLILITSSLVLGYVTLSLSGFGWSLWLVSSALALLILTVNSFGYKIGALFFNSNAEIHHWTLQQYGFKEESYFKKPFPMWIFFPLLLYFITLETIKWLAITTFEATPLPSRAQRKFSNITDWDLALMAATGLLFNVVLAFLSKLLGYNSFASLNLAFVLFNLIPFGTLSGSKILFGSRLLWVFSVVIALSMLLLFEIIGAVYTVITAVILAAAVAALFYYLVEA